MGLSRLGGYDGCGRTIRKKSGPISLTTAWMTHSPFKTTTKFAAAHIAAIGSKPAVMLTGAPQRHSARPDDRRLNFPAQAGPALGAAQHGPQKLPRVDANEGRPRSRKGIAAQAWHTRPSRA